MNAVPRRPIPGPTRAAFCTLTAVLLLGGSWGAAAPARAGIADSRPDWPGWSDRSDRSAWPDLPDLPDRSDRSDQSAWTGDTRSRQGLAYARPADTEPEAIGGPWQSQRARVYGAWPSGRPESWSSPVANFRVSAPYGIKGDWKAGHHTGIDLAVPVGTPVRSVSSGTVVFSGSSGDYGETITIRMTDGNYTLFAHLSRRQVREGDRVQAGTLLGESGNTGRSTGPHLHFEVRSQRDYGTDIDPVAYLARHGVRIG